MYARGEGTLSSQHVTDCNVESDPDARWIDMDAGRIRPYILLGMPLYDFVCKTCRHEFEALVRVNDTPTCPACRGTDLERLLSTFAVDSAERRQAAARDSRRRQIAKRRDSFIAEEEYRQRHDKE